MRTLTGGTVAFGTFSSADHLLHTELATRFHALYPKVRLRLVGMNSVQVADSVRAGDLEAGLVALPVDDRGLDVGPVVWTTEAVYLSRDRTRTRTAKAIQEVAEAHLVLPEVRWGDMDPTRRQLVTLAQNAGVSLRPVVEGRVTRGRARARPAWRRGHDHLPRAGEGDGRDEQVALGLARPAAARDVRVHHPTDATPSPATTILINLARQILADIPAAA